MKKRVLSMLLVMIMVLAMLPAAVVMAEETAAEETVITLDFDADANKGKALTAFTVEEDGWEYDDEASYGGSPVFFQYNSGTDTTTHWDYKCLRFTQSEVGGTMVLNFAAPATGTYTMELTYCYGGPGHYTDVTVGGTLTQYFGWSPWGTAPATVVTEGVELKEGSNAITLTTREDVTNGNSYIMVKNIVFTKQPDPTSGLVIDLAAAANAEAELSTYAVTGSDTVKELGWGIDTDETAPFKNPTQTFLYYVVKGNTVNTPALEDGTAAGVYIATISGNGGLAMNFYVPKDGYYVPTISAVSNTRCGVSEIYVDGTSVGTYDGYGTDAPVITEHAMDEVYLTRGVHKVLIKCIEASPKYSNYAWAYVNEVEFVEICKHFDTETVGEAAGNGKHTVTEACADCGEEVSVKTESCADADENALCDVCNTLIAVTYDFNAAYDQGKTLAAFTVETDGWEYDYDASYGGSPVFFRYSSGTEETNWDYTCLRFTLSEVDDAMVLNFVAPCDGTYTLDLTYCYGGPGNYTDVTVGGVTGQYFGWSAWGTAPGTMILEDVELKEGVNTITLSIAAETSNNYIMVKDMTFTKQAAPASGLIIDLAAAANAEAELSTLAVTGTEFPKELGWGINTDETAPFKNPTQTFLYYVVKGNTANTPALEDGTVPGVYIATISGNGGLTINFNVPEDGYYAPVVSAVSNTRCGVSTVYVDGEEAGTYDGYGTDAPVITEHTMNTVYLTKGVHKVMVKGTEASPKYSNYAWAYVNKIEFEAVTVECGHENTTSATVSNEDGTHTTTVTCECGEVVSTETVDCSDAGEGTCVCGYEIPCEHTETTTETTANDDKTHTVTVTCACGEVVSTETVACADGEDEDTLCDVCGNEIPCEHTETTTETAANDDKTHTVTVTCDCGEVVSTETVACADGEDEDTLCDVCGNELAEEVVIEKFSVAGANMTLGNELEMNVMFPKTAIDNAGTELTAYVTHYSETGDVVHTFTEFDAYGSSYYKLSFRVAAAQMTDTIAVEFKDADGNVYNNEYTNSVRNYVMNNIGRFNTTIQTLMVDMLNYGAAAQDQFTYHQDEYANALLSDEQKALATGDVEVTDLRVKGTNYAGSTLSLEDRILLNIVFNGKFTADELAAMSATVSFDNALDGVTQTHENAAITAYGSSRFQVTVDQIVLADSSQPVTVTVYNADGTEYGSAVDSVSSYICRMDDGTNPMYSSIMKFATSALAYGQSK